MDEFGKQWDLYAIILCAGEQHFNTYFYMDIYYLSQKHYQYTKIFPLKGGQILNILGPCKELSLIVNF